jgi:hypothetical protein
MDNPEWADVTARLTTLRSKPAEGQTGGRNALMIDYLAPGHGFYVTAPEENEPGESILKDLVEMAARILYPRIWTEDQAVK